MDFLSNFFKPFLLGENLSEDDEGFDYDIIEVATTTKMENPTVMVSSLLS